MSFGFGSGNTGSTFGGFGSTNNNNTANTSGGSLFGGNTSTAGGFGGGATGGFGGGNTSNPFGQSQNKTGFGSPAPATGGSMFGATGGASTTGGFGGGASGGFGAANNTASTGFGATQTTGMSRQLRAQGRMEKPSPKTAKMNSKLTHIQAVVSSVRASLQLVVLAAALPHRLPVASLAPQTLVDSALPTRPHRAILSAVALQAQTTHLVEETQVPASALATRRTRPDQASRLEEETQLLRAMRPKAPLPLPSRRLPRKMALALARPVLIRVSPCSHSTRTRASRS